MAEVVFIPFRSGSTRIPNKNIRHLGKFPLVVWSVIAATKARLVDKIVLSSDSTEYLSLVSRCLDELQIDVPAIEIDLRDAEYSQTTSKVFDYIKDGLSPELVADDDTLIQLLPTCPFRKPENLAKAISAYKISGKGLFSCVEYDFRISFAFLARDDGFEPLFRDSPLLTGNTQSQGHPSYLHPCGSFNIFRMGDARNSMSTIYTNCVPYIVSRQESIDIDTEEDFLFASMISNAFLIESMLND